MTWHRLGPEVPGGWGEQTQADFRVHPPVVTTLHVEFAGWLGDDLVESFPCYLVSHRLAEALSETALTGFVLDDVVVSLDPQFVSFFPEEAAALPEWRWLRLIGTPWESDFWADTTAGLHVGDAALAVLVRFRLDQCEITFVST
jgi:hypothetical protein